ncbi:MAG: YgfZ/GcvT domain-containing protein [Stellaceae bacterium]
MVERSCTLLGARAVLEIAGADRRAFLQGLVSNDVEKVTADRAVYAALLTAQGRYLHDFFIAEIGEAFLLDAEAARLADLKRRLGLYRLRARVTLGENGDRYIVAAAFGSDALSLLDLPAEPGAVVPFAGGLAYVDPRLPELGARLLLRRGAGLAPLESAGFRIDDGTEYDRLRLSLGIPDGSRDLPVEKAILLESGFEELNGVDWQKGCYIGQELTARTKYRALIKKRLLPVAVEGPLPAPGTPVMLGDQEAGEMRSGRDGLGLALLRLEALGEASADKPLTAGTARLVPKKPRWANF